MKAIVQTFSDFIASDSGREFRLLGMSEEQMRRDGWIVVSMPSRAETMPPWLLELDDSIEVALSTAGVTHAARPVTAGLARFMFKELINRTAHQRYSQDDLVRALSEQTGQSLRFFYDATGDGYANGWLRFWLPDGSPAECPPSPDDGLGFEHCLGLSDEYTTPEAINNWLEEWGATYRLEPYRTKAYGKKQPRQQELILETIRAMGLDPEALPHRKQGASGTKAEVRKQLENHPLFSGAKHAFNTAWRDLRLKG